MSLALHPPCKPPCRILFSKCLFYKQNPQVSFLQFNLTASNFDYKPQASFAVVCSRKERGGGNKKKEEKEVRRETLPVPSTG